MGVIFSAVGFVVGLGPDTAGKTLFGKQMYGVAQVLITSPALMAFAMFAGALGYRRSAR
jgi:ABC-type dipeptide/oligopeptide/nickel transport system permease subunit